MTSALRRCVHLAITGVVQGVGFRPAVLRLARAHRLTGCVRNTTVAAAVVAEGEHDAIEAFIRSLKSLPRPIRVASVSVSEAPCRGHEQFVVSASLTTATSALAGATPLSADHVTCPACLAEVFTPTDRRFSYPFTHCTACGPRYSITERLPFDRENTTQSAFVLCPECRHEYEDLAGRRLHAQIVGCPSCGPQLSFEEKEGTPTHFAQAALERATETLRNGAILAVMGVGGFQLLADATNPNAAAELRRRKRRPDKPFAVLFRDLAEVNQHCVVSDTETAALTSAEGPVVLLERRRRVLAGTPPLSDGVGALLRVGALLPTTALHALLVTWTSRPLICTSGNDSGEPLCHDVDSARRRVADVADAFLHHDRRIARRIDDSVAQVVGGRLQLIRRARGYVPAGLPLGKSGTQRCVVALGGHLKNAFCIASGPDAWLGPHLGESGLRRGPSPRGSHARRVVVTPWRAP